MEMQGGKSPPLHVPFNRFFLRSAEGEIFFPLNRDNKDDEKDILQISGGF